MPVLSLSGRLLRRVQGLSELIGEYRAGPHRSPQRQQGGLWGQEKLHLMVPVHSPHIAICGTLREFVAVFCTLAPLPSAAASVPVWQDRTIASSRLRLLEYSAFMEVQRDPDTVPWGWGQGLCGPGPPLRVMGLGHRGVGGGLSPCSLSPPRPGACTLVCSPDPVLGPPHSTANTCLCTSARRTPPSQTRPWRQWMCVRYTTSSPRRRVA